MRSTDDTTADAAYLSLVDSIGTGEAARQAVVEAEGLRAMVVLDFDREDRLLGIEIVGASSVLRPDTIAALTRL